MFGKQLLRTLEIVVPIALLILAIYSTYPALQKLRIRSRRRNAALAQGPRARIALAYAPGLRPGGFASAVLNSGTIVAPLLPESAIQSDDKGRFVYLVGSDNRVHRRAVKTGIVTGEGVAVTDGLAGTERVVLRAGGFLADGDKVKPQRAK